MKTGDFSFRVFLITNLIIIARTKVNNMAISSQTNLTDIIIATNKRNQETPTTSGVDPPTR